MNIRREPTRSANRPPGMRKPPKASVYAVITQCRPPPLNPSDSPTTGSAVVTIVASSTTTNCATQATAMPSRRLELFPVKTLIPETQSWTDPKCNR